MLAAAAGDGPLGVERGRSPGQAIGAMLLRSAGQGWGAEGRTVVTREGTEPQAEPGLEGS